MPTPIDDLPEHGAGAEGHAVGTVAGSAGRFKTEPWTRGRGKGTADTSGASYTLVLGDEGLLIRHTHSTLCVVNVPTNAAVPFPIGARVRVLQEGVGKITITALSGVTIRNAGKGKTRARYSLIELQKVEADVWVMWGDSSAT